MRFLTQFSLRNPVAITIFVLIIAVGGILSAFGLQEDLMPDMSLPIISVMTTYPGASPSQVATDITTPIEKALNGTQDVQTITSTSVANVSQIELQLNMNANLNTVVQNVDQVINQVPLPATSGKPTVQSFSFSNAPVLEFTVASSKLSIEQLKELVNNTVIPTLQGVSGVATVSASGAYADNVVIQFDPAKLTKYNLTMQQVLQDLESDNVSMPLGSATAQGKVQPVQLNAAPTSLADIRNLRIGIPSNPSAEMQKTLSQMGQSIGQVGQGVSQVGQTVGLVQAQNNILTQLQQIQGQIFGAELTLNGQTSIPRAQQSPQEIAKLQTQIRALEDAQNQLQQRLALLASKVPKVSTPLGSPESVASTADATSTSPSTLQTILLSEIATVSMQPPIGSSINRTNGQPSILVTVSKTENANTVTVVKAIHTELSTLTHQFPTGVHIVPLFDSSSMITASVNGMLREAILGAIFAIIVILLFLRNGLTTIVAIVSIPLSILTAMILLNRYGITLNIMTLGGLAVATGRVVDDSIVVIENIYRTWKHGFGFGKKLVLYATAEVGNAILSSTLATIAVFLPLAFVGGLVGKIFFPFALTVVCSLASSLIVALTVVPMLAWLFVVRKPVKGATYDWLKDGEAAGGLIHPSLEDGSGTQEFIKQSDSVATTTVPRPWQKRYQSILNWCLNHKVLVICGTTSAFVASLAVLPLVGSTFIQNTMQQTATVSITMPVGTPLNVTDAKAHQVEAALKQDASQIEQVDTSVGGGGGFTSSASSTNVASLDIALKSTTNVNQFLTSVRSQTANLAPTGTNIQVKGQTTGGGATTFDVVITGSNNSARQYAATQITDTLRIFPDLSNVQSNLAQTQPVVSIVPNFTAMAKYGLTAQQIAGDIRDYISQQNIGTMNLAGQTYNLDVALTSATELNNLSAIRQLPISATTGQTITLGDVASVNSVQTPTSILHSDGQAYVEITADYTAQNTNKTLNSAMKTIQSLNLPPGVHVAQSSSALQQNQSFTQLIEAIIVAVGMVYIVMLVLFGGWSAPLAILFSMPVALIGAFFATFIAHQPLSVSSLIGILMLMGIVVTNAIVLIQRVEQQRRIGLGVRAALLEAGTTRLRPILMTAVATICALVPLAVGASDGVLISQGLAVVVIGGLITSTVLTLCIVPLIYELLHLRTHRREMYE